MPGTHFLPYAHKQMTFYRQDLCKKFEDVMTEFQKMSNILGLPHNQ